MEAWKIVFKDRFLGSEKKENIVTVIILYLLIALLCFLLIFILFFQLCFVDGNSMNNTLYNEDHVLLLKTHNNIKIGDVVVINKENNNNVSYNIIKRVIALPGDSIKFVTKNNEILLYRKLSSQTEFTQVVEPFIAEPMKNLPSWYTAKPNTDGITIKDGYVFVMGDNRNHSEDSRGIDGPYKISAIYGKMALRIEKDSLLEKFLKILYQEKPKTSSLIY